MNWETQLDGALWRLLHAKGYLDGGGLLRLLVDKLKELDELVVRDLAWVVALQQLVFNEPRIVWLHYPDFRHYGKPQSRRQAS